MVGAAIANGDEPLLSGWWFDHRAWATAGLTLFAREVRDGFATRQMPVRE